LFLILLPKICFAKLFNIETNLDFVKSLTVFSGEIGKN